MEIENMEKANNLYLGDRPVKEFGKVPLEDVDQYWVMYGDGLKPEGDVIHADEWELKTEEPNKDRQAYFVKSIQGVQKNILKELVSHNILWADVQSTMDWVMEAIRNVRDELNNRLFKTERWELDLTPQKCIEALKANGTEPKTPDLNAVEKVIYDHILSEDVKMTEVKQGFPSILSLKKIAEAVFDLQIQALESFLDSTTDRWRMQQIEDAILRLRETSKDSQDGSSSDGDAESNSSGENSEGSPTEPQPQGK